MKLEKNPYSIGGPEAVNAGYTLRCFGSQRCVFPDTIQKKPVKSWETGRTFASSKAKV